MPLQIPTLPELVERTRRIMRANLPGTDAWLWPNNIAVSVKVMAGAVLELFLWLDYIAKQRFVNTADGEFLDKHAQQYGMSRLPPSYAQGSAVFTGTAGTTIPVGTQVDRGDGQRYTTTQSGKLDGVGTATLAIRADEAGLDGNALPNTPLTLTASIDGVDSQALVSADGLGAGADLESDESLRHRLLHRLQYPPHGGAAHDYVAWARSINGVTRVWVEPLQSGPGTVGVYFLMDETYPDGIPQQSDVDVVAAYIDLVRPVTAQVNVAAPIPAPVDIVIQNLQPDTTEVRTAVEQELADLFRREVAVGTDSEPYTLYRSKLWQAIADAAGEESHVLVQPDTDVTYTGGQIPVLNSVSYI